MKTEFKINSIFLTTHDSSFGGYPWKVQVELEISAKEWTKIRNAKELGQLYGIDVGNAVYRVNGNIPAHNPSVDDSRRALHGLKRINLTYYLNNPDKAAAMGAKVMRFKDGTFAAGFHEHINLLSKE